MLYEWAVYNHVKGTTWQTTAEKLAYQIEKGQWPKKTLGPLLDSV